MNPVRSIGRMSSWVYRRAIRFLSGGLIIALVVVLVMAVIAWSALRQSFWSSQEDGGPLMHTVQSGQFIHEVTERGNVESASNVEIVCRVKSSGSSRSAILQIVSEGTVIKPEDCLPEGATVTFEALERYEQLRQRRENVNERASPQVAEIKPAYARPLTAEGKPENSKPENGKPEAVLVKAEDLLDKARLVKLDSSSLENDQTQQEIIVHESMAKVIKTQNALDTAKIEKEEYLDGTYKETKQGMESDIIKAKEALARAREYRDYSKLLYAKGYISERELEANQFDVKKRTLDLEMTETALKVLAQYTWKKRKRALEANIATAEADLKAEAARHKLKVEKLAEIEEQLVNCTIFATAPGQVVYANVPGGRGRAEVVIEEGTTVRQGQTIIRLPDPKRMQVKAQINEAKVTLVKVGMPATVRLDAFADAELTGAVERVRDYPLPTSWHNASVKEYETIIRIDEPPPGLRLRPGLTAEVKILIEQVPDVVRVPVQTIFEHGAKHYCVMKDGSGFRAHEVKIGSTNDKLVVIDQGLQAGQEIVYNALVYRDKVDLPELAADSTSAPKRSPVQAGAADSTSAPKRSPGQAGAAGAAGGMFTRLDKNGNGRIDKSEMPEQMRSRMAAADTNGDGAIDRQELSAAMSRMGQRGGTPSGRRPGGNP